MSRYDGSHKYQVVFVDEYSNWWLCGFYDDLNEALPQANAFLSQYKSDPSEETGTSGPSFGKEFATPCGCVSIRGFVLL